MTRIEKTTEQEAPTRLMGTLAIMGLAAEKNLRDVAQALGKRDLTGMSRVEERNEKQSRLRAEIEEQIVGEMSQRVIGTRFRRHLILSSQIAAMYERMGSRTVEIAQLSRELIREPRPARVTELKKLIEHAVYITDRAVGGFTEEEVELARIAREQKLAATDLSDRINRDLAVLTESRGEGTTRADLICRIACKAHEIVEEAGKLADDVISFLEKPEI